MPSPDLVAVKRALISVSDKSGLVEFARAVRGVPIAEGILGTERANEREKHEGQKGCPCRSCP